MRRPAAPDAAGSDDSDTAWVIHCDGSAVPNPGRMGLGAVMTGPGGARHTISLATHTTGCNNEAELRALMRALQWLAQQGVAASTPVQVFSDNSVLVAQLGTQATPPIARLAPLFDEARRQLQGFGPVGLQWIPRQRNGAADALARAALGLAPKAGIPHALRKKKRR